MNIIEILLKSLGVLIVIRLLLIGIDILCQKLFKGQSSDKPFMISVALLCIFLMFYNGFADKISMLLSNLEWYVFYVFVGGVGIIWSYIEWDTTSIKVLPKLETDKKQMAIKKLIIFSLVFVYSIRSGYEFVISKLNDQEIHFDYIIVNYAIVGCMIALDRVMNQIHTIYAIKREEKEKKQ